MNDTTSSEHATEPSVVDSLVRVIEAGQRLLVDRLDLARFDLGKIVTRSLRGAAFIAGGAVLLTGACFALIGGAIMWLHQSMDLSLAASCLIVAAATAVVGAVIIFTGIRRTQPEREELDTAGALVGSLHGPASVAGDGGRRP